MCAGRESPVEEPPGRVRVRQSGPAFGADTLDTVCEPLRRRPVAEEEEGKAYAAVAQRDGPGTGGRARLRGLRVAPPPGSTVAVAAPPGGGAGGQAGAGGSRGGCRSTAFPGSPRLAQGSAGLPGESTTRCRSERLQARTGSSSCRTAGTSRTPCGRRARRAVSPGRGLGPAPLPSTLYKGACTRVGSETSASENPPGRGGRGDAPAGGVLAAGAEPEELPGGAPREQQRQRQQQRRRQPRRPPGSAPRRSSAPWALGSHPWPKATFGPELL